MKFIDTLTQFSTFLPYKQPQVRRNGKNSVVGGWDFIKKCWPSWLADLENCLIKIV